MNAHVKRQLLIVFLAVSCSLNLFHFTHSAQGIKQKQLPKTQGVNVVSLGLPMRLIIPAINVNAKIQHLGVTSNGEMEVPKEISEVAWFKLGSRPGEKGSAVIAGHLDGKNGEAGVFINLNMLKEGDKLYIEDDKGRIVDFSVREKRAYDLGYAEDVFSRNDSSHLNLITCGGVWDGAKNSYSKRLVVFADRQIIFKNR